MLAHAPGSKANWLTAELTAHSGVRKAAVNPGSPLTWACPGGRRALGTVLSFPIAPIMLRPDQEDWGAAYRKLRTSFSPIVITISVIH